MRRLFVLAVFLALPHTVHAQSPTPGKLINCVVTTATDTALALIGGDCNAARRDIQEALYITDISVGVNAVGIAADSFPTLKYGTGTVCATGTTIKWLAIISNGTFTTAPFNLFQSFKSPLRIPPGNDLCWISSTAASKTWVISGYAAP